MNEAANRDLIDPDELRAALDDVPPRPGIRPLRKLLDRDIYAGVVVEADSLRFHRTPSQQAKDTRRDHAYAVAGLLPLRFTHHQITYEQRYVEDTLREAVDSRPSRSSTERPHSRHTRRKR